MLRGLVLACAGYLAVVYGVAVALGLVAARVNRRRLREARAEGWDVIARSRFTIPVTVVAPMRNEEVLAAPVVDALLDLDYPEFEVVVVNDGSTDGTLAVLRAAYDLEPVAYLERRVIETAPVRGVYRSRRTPRLLVVDKEGGGKADALNCGLNFSRLRYVCAVDGDTVYDRHALAHSMRLVLRDPATVVGLTSHIEVATHPEVSYERSGGLLRSTLLHSFQHLEYLRSFLIARLAWSAVNGVVCTSGAFMLYRRDVLEEVGGFSSDFSCEDIELTFRVHEHFRRHRRPYRILSMPEAVARTEGPDTIRSLLSQRTRWQRVMLETAWHYRRLALNPRYGAFGLVAVPFCILSEVLAPLVEAVALATLAAAAALGAPDWPAYGLVFGTMSLVLAVLSAIAVRLEDVATRSYPLRDLVWLLVLAPLELAVYRPFLLWAHVRGVVGFARGDRRWERFARNRREAPSGVEPL